MKNILIASGDSEIGFQLYHILKHDNTVYVTSRDPEKLKEKNSFNFDLIKNHTIETDIKFDELWFTIGISSKHPLDRINVFRTNAIKAYDFLDWAATHIMNDKSKIRVLSSQWGSIGEVNSFQDYPYRMSKAALNMGVSILNQKYPSINWLLMHPGLVTTKMTEGVKYKDLNPVSPVESATKLIQISDKTNNFCFIDINNRIVSW